MLSVKLLALAALLLAHGPRPSPRDAALIRAIDAGRPGLVRRLLAHGADVRAVDAEGNTALSEAAIDIGDGHYGRAEGLPIVQALLAHGADPQAKNSYGYTPMMLADDRGVDWLVRLLRRTGRQKKGGPKASPICGLNYLTPMPSA